MATKKNTEVNAQALANATNAISSDRQRLVDANLDSGLFVKCEKASVSGGFTRSKFVVSKAQYEKEELKALASEQPLDTRFRLVTPNETEVIKHWRNLCKEHDTIEANVTRFLKAQAKLTAKSS